MSVAIGNFAGLVQVLTPTTPKAFNIDTGSGASRQSIVWITVGSLAGVFPTITSITVGGTDALSAITGTSVTSGLYRIEAWGGPLTLTGTRSVSIAFTNSGGNYTLGAIGLTASGTDLVNNGASTSNTGSPISLGMTSPIGDASATGILHNGTGAPTSNRTSFYNDGASDRVAGSYYLSVLADQAHTWTGTGVNWSHAVVAGVNFRASSSQSQAPRSMHHYRMRRT